MNWRKAIRDFFMPTKPEQNYYANGRPTVLLFDESILVDIPMDRIAMKKIMATDFESHNMRLSFIPKDRNL